MSDNIDNLLSSVGIALTSNSLRPAPPTQTPVHEPEPEPVAPPEQEEEETVPLSDEDFLDILSDNGFPSDSRQAEEEPEPEEENEGEEEEPDIALSPEEEQEEQEEQIPENLEMIPENSPTFMMDTTSARFSGAEWYKAIQDTSIIVAGIGGIGSNLAFQLARMLPREIFMYDDDDVESVNMSGQLYSYNDIGRHKVDAVASMITKYTAAQNIYSIISKFDENSTTGPVMMCGFDNMNARKVFYQRWRTYVLCQEEDKRSKCLLLDGRLSMDVFQIFCIRGDDEYNMARYEKDFLFSDADAEETVCSMKQTTYLACMIASVMVNLFTNFVANTLDPIIPYNMPFFTEYDAQHMIFKIEN